MSGNTAHDYGGAIQNTGTLTITDSTFSGNRPSTGGGIFSYRGGTLTISNSTFSGNTSTLGAGGGIVSAQTGSTLTITASTFHGNAAPEGGGGGVYTGGSAPRWFGSWVRQPVSRRGPVRSNTSLPRACSFIPRRRCARPPQRGRRAHQLR
jgi:hypothetical protein